MNETELGMYTCHAFWTAIHFRDYKKTPDGVEELKQETVEIILRNPRLCEDDRRYIAEHLDSKFEEYKFQTFH